MGDEEWLDRAVQLAVDNVARGGGPFGAVVVRDGELLATGVNRVTATLDPTAHAEVVAIRGACRAVRDFRLPRAVLYSSCEPCPLCLTAALWSRLERVVYSADRRDAAAAGFDDEEFDELFHTLPARWPMPVVAVRTPRASDPFAAWEAQPDKVPY